jgi:hypothetical protein|tara:strand:+ start:256 stop:489 length:234 start_codon:yes stop_codon:yes gene_type:complete
MAWSNVYNGKPVESGQCPHCNSMGLLDYKAKVYSSGNSIYYPFECEECGCKGKEWNVVKFDGMEITKRPKESEVCND